MRALQFLMFAIFAALAGSAGVAYANNEDKVTICHHTGSQTNPTVTITVSENAWKAHEKHGDTRGPCPAVSTATPKGTATPVATGKPSATPGVTGSPSAAPTARPSASAGVPGPSTTKGPGADKVTTLPSTSTE